MDHFWGQSTPQLAQVQYRIISAAVSCRIIRVSKAVFLLDGLPHVPTLTALDAGAICLRIGKATKGRLLFPDSGEHDLIGELNRYLLYSLQSG